MRRLLPLLVIGLVATAGSAVSAAPVAADQSPPEVTLLEKGDGPQRELRYEVATGDEQLIRLSTLTRISQKVGNNPVGTGVSPKIAFDVKISVLDVAADGVITVSYVYVAYDLGSESGTSAAEEQLDAIVGLTSTFTMTDLGQVLSSEPVELSDDLDPTTASLIQQLSGQASQLAVPFPEERVGKGARWKAVTTATVSGVEINQTVVYEVESIDEGRVQLSSTVTQRSDRQTYEDPATGDTFEVLRSRGTGDGDSTVRLNRVSPIKGDAHVQVRQKLRDADGEDISQTLTTHVFIDAP